MTLRLLLISSILFSGLLKADVDLARLPSSWTNKPVPEVLSDHFKTGPVSPKAHYTTANGDSTFTHLTTKLDTPYTTANFEKAVRDITAGFRNKANYPLRKSEVVEKDGLRLLHLETENNRWIRLVSLTQICPDKFDQIILTVPASDYDALVPQAYKLFTPVPPPAESTGATAPDDRSSSDPLEEMGAMIAKICIGIFVAGVLLKILIAAGKKKPKRRR